MFVSEFQRHAEFVVLIPFIVLCGICEIPLKLVQGILVPATMIFCHCQFRNIIVIWNMYMQFVSSDDVFTWCALPTADRGDAVLLSR